MKLAYILALCVLAAATPVAAKTHHHANLHQRPALFKGSSQKMARENKRMDRAHLPRFNERQLVKAERAHRLIRIPHNHALGISPNLHAEYRYCRPEAVSVLENLSGAYHTKYGAHLTVTSCARSFEKQRKLMKGNKNAARGKDHGHLSLHLTGYAFDITKKGMTADEIVFVRAFLFPLMKEGRVSVTEETQQPCFHVVVFPMRVDKPHHRTLKRAAHKAARLSLRCRVPYYRFHWETHRSFGSVLCWEIV